MFAGALLLLAATEARAFDVLKTEALLPHFEEVASRAGVSVVVAAAGGPADQTLKRLVRAAPETPVLLDRVPVMGDPEEDMTRLLARVGKPCGLRVSSGGIEGEWIVTEFGACGGPSAAVGEGWTAPPTGDPLAPYAIPESGLGLGGSPAAPSIDPARLLLLDHSVPDPTTALLMSAVVGFGSGQFYAHNPRVGLVHAGLQGAGLVVFGVARLAGNNALTTSGGEVARVISDVGLMIMVGSRLVEAGTAPGAAQDEAARQISREMR